MRANKGFFRLSNFIGNRKILFLNVVKGKFSLYICAHKLCDMKNVTLSIPDDLLKKSREYAEKHGASLNELIRLLLKQVVNPPENDPIQKLISRSQSKRLAINTKNWKWNRNELYDRKIFS